MHVHHFEYLKKIQLSNEVAYAESILDSPRSDGSLKSFFLAHSIPHQATKGGAIDNTETDQQALAPQKKYYCFASNEALFAAMKLYKQLHCQLCCLVKF